MSNESGEIAEALQEKEEEIPELEAEEKELKEEYRKVCRPMRT